MPEYYSSTHIGKVRTTNEDFLMLNEALNFGVIADGVGGQHHGDVASKLAVESCFYYLTQEELLSEASDIDHLLKSSIQFSNEKVISLKQNDKRYKNMASTLTCFHLEGLCLHYAFIGDTRIYKINLQHNYVQQLSFDHTLDPNKIDPTLAPKLHKKAKHILTKVIGSFLLLKADSGKEQLIEGDYVLACTDGLYNHLEPEDFLACLKKNDQGLGDFGDTLLNTALADGGLDNISFILAKV